MRLSRKLQAFLAGFVAGAVPSYLQASGAIDVLAALADSPVGRLFVGGAATIQTFIAAYGVWAFLTASFLKGMLLFPILPESVTPIYVLHAADSVVDVVVIAVAAAGVITAANTVIYLLSRLAGERLFAGRNIPLRGILDVLVTQHGRTSMVVSRIIPFIGAWAAIPAGIARLRMRIFVVYTFIGFLLYEGGLALLAWYGIRHGMLPEIAFLQALVPAG